MTDLSDLAARGFAAAADAYERGRPAYPEEAIDCLARELDLRPGRSVLDLGAGTGKLTRLLATTGANVVAVEPVAEMRDRLQAKLPMIEALEGTAEAIPLPSASVDAVVVGQAFHWFRAAEAVSEIHRVLRPGGRLGLIWNIRDESVSWVARLGELIDLLVGDAPRHETGAWRDAFERTTLFGPLTRVSFRHIQVGDRAMVRDRVASISYVAAAPEAVRVALLEAIDGLLTSDPGTRTADRIELPYRADVYWTERLGGPTVARGREPSGHGPAPHPGSNAVWRIDPA